MKGIKKNVKKTLTFEDYKRCLFKREEQMRKMNIIKSDKHKIYSIEVNKIALSDVDGKRIILENRIETKAFR